MIFLFRNKRINAYINFYNIFFKLGIKISIFAHYEHQSLVYIVNRNCEREINMYSSANRKHCKFCILSVTWLPVGWWLLRRLYIYLQNNPSIPTAHSTTEYILYIQKHSISLYTVSIILICHFEGGQRFLVDITLFANLSRTPITVSSLLQQHHSFPAQLAEHPTNNNYIITHSIECGESLS